VDIVPFGGSDHAYRQRVAILKEAQPGEPWSIEGERASDEADAATGRPGCAFFAEAAGERLGFARARVDLGDAAPGRHRIWVAVLRRWRRRGIGTALLDALGEAAAAQGATHLHASASLAEPDGLAFALAHGFEEVESEVELHLDLGSFDPAGFGEPAPVPGLVLERLATLRRSDADWFEHYYLLHTGVEATAPWALGHTLPDREAFRRASVEAPEALAEGTAIAVLDGEWVGLCELWRSGDDAATVYQELTGVLPAQRRRGIGTAVVVAAADWCRGRGYRRMVTSTGTDNEAMQALARRLGFGVAARWSHFLGPTRRRGVASGREVGL
jgi:mycothiol synthase